MRRTGLFVGLASVMSAGMILLASPATAYPPKHGTISLTSYAVKHLVPDTGHGTGFTPGEGVNAYAHSVTVFLGHTTANANGAATITFTVPASLPAGKHTFQMVGQKSGRSLSVGFTVLGSSAAVGASNGSGLPFTGGNEIWPMTATGVGLVLAGGIALGVVRRRRSHSGLAA